MCEITVSNILIKIIFGGVLEFWSFGVLSID